MTFINPAILWALTAVSIPIIIHIFNLKKTKKIEISTLMFLKEIQQSKYKKIKLKQLLILLCRIAFIILFVMMFAKPFYNGYLGGSEKANSSVLIILDDSFSMQTREASGNNFENAKVKINELLGVLNEGDEVFFTTASQINRIDKSFLYKDVNAVRDSLAKLKTSDVTKSLDEVLYFSNEILKSAANTYKEVYIFTDGQKSFTENPGILSEGIKTGETKKLNIVLTGNRAANNLSIDTINTVTKIFEKNKPVKLKVSLTNHNNFNALNKNVVLNFGSFKDEKAIDMPANSTIDVEFMVTPGKTGFAGGNIELIQNEISDDEISADNKQYFSFFTPRAISLLIVSGSQSDADYIKLALVSSEEMLKDSLGNKTQYFNTKQVSSNEFSAQNLSDYNSVVIINKSQFSQAEAQKLKSHIENGGGVILYPGNTTTPESFNEVLFKELDIPPLNGRFGSGNEVYKFDNLDYAHPIFEGIFKPGTSGKNAVFESPEIRSGISISKGNNSISLITLNNEKNFMVEYNKGKGKLIIFAVSPDMGNSDYPLKNLFSPITVRSILYLANINSIKPAITGRDYFIDISSITNLPDTLKLSSSGENKFVNFPLQSPNGIINPGGNTTITANYYITQNGKEIYNFPANFNKIESQTVRIEPKEMANYLKDKWKLEANIIKSQETVSASVLELRTGRDLWQYFLLAALLFLVIEYFLSRSLALKK